jgi:phytol kinase
MIQDPWIAGLFAVSIFAFWMGLVVFLQYRLAFGSSITRKIIHIGTGPIFMLTWVLFPNIPISKYLAAVIPLTVVSLLVFTGFGIVKNPILIKLMARRGDGKELFSGPLFYGLVFVLLAIFFWKSVYAIIPLTILCVGDGFAEVIGSSSRSQKLPWSRKKTIVGSCAMFFIGTISCYLLVFSVIPEVMAVQTWSMIILGIIIINFISTCIESVSPSNLDNLTVPAAALLSTLLIFPKG